MGVPVLPAFLGATLILAFVAQFLYYHVRRQLRLGRAVETTGTVTRASIAEVEDNDVFRYEPSVVFEYEFDGRAMQSGNVCPCRGRLAPSRLFRDRAAAERLVDEYEPGSEVTVHVDPEAPMEGFLIDSVCDADVARTAAKRAVVLTALAGLLVGPVLTGEFGSGCASCG